MRKNTIDRMTGGVLDSALVDSLLYQNRKCETTSLQGVRALIRGIEVLTADPRDLIAQELERIADEWDMRDAYVEDPVAELRSTALKYRDRKVDLDRAD